MCYVVSRYHLGKNCQKNSGFYEADIFLYLLLFHAVIYYKITVCHCLIKYSSLAPANRLLQSLYILIHPCLPIQSHE